MLETIREYASERLAASGEKAERRRHHALFTVDSVEAMWRGREEGGDQAELSARVAAENENVRAALEWTRDTGADEVLLRLVAAVCMVWLRRGLYEEADRWLSLALERAESPVEARMGVLWGASSLATQHGEYDRADELVAEWRTLAEQAGDEDQLLAAMNSAARVATERGDLADAWAQHAAIRERAREIGDRDRIAIATVNLGLVALRSEDFEAGLAYADEAAELFRENNDDGGMAVALNNGGYAALELSDPARAQASFREALVIAARVGWKALFASIARGLGAALVAQHDEERGAQVLAAAMSLHEELGIGFDDELDEATYDRAVADAKAALGEEAFAAARARGEGMTPEEIIAFTMPA
jgi:tetratricopeptide (TPR) repeat protein